MRILIDLQGAQSISRHRGIGRYSLSLALAIAKDYHPKHDVVILLNAMLPDAVQSIREAFHSILPSSSIKVWQGCGPVNHSDTSNTSRIKASSTLRESYIAMLHPDIILITSAIEGYHDNALISSLTHYNIPSATIFYDAIPYMNADKYITPQGKCYEKFYYEKIDIIKNANLVFSISNSACNEAIDILHIDKNKVNNISAAADDYFYPLSYATSNPKNKLQHLGIEKKFILYTGASDERKNRLRLVEAFALLSEKHQEEYQLVIAGLVTPESTHNIQKHIHKCHLTSQQVIFTNTVTDKELLDLYNLCDVYVFASYHEGFGLPALEAMQCGAAVIGANTTSVPEVIGREDALFNPFCTTSIAEKIEEVLDNPSFMASLQKHGLEQSKKFSWKQSAKYLMQNIETWHANCTKSTNIKKHDIKKQLLGSIASISLDDSDLCHCAKAIVGNHTQIKKKQLLLDVSELTHRDAKTGIQRVVRSILYEILQHHSIEQYTIKTIYFDGEIYRNTVKFHPNPEMDLDHEVINFHEDDIYLSLDLNSQFTEYTYHLHRDFQNIGVKVYFIIYDILLVRRSDWWPQGTSTLFKKWLHNAIETSTGLICISKTVADDVQNWIDQHPPKRKFLPTITHFHLGADIASSVPTKGCPADEKKMLSHMRIAPTFIIVGTIEPRKGHHIILKGFEKLWDKNININLVIVGKEGWLVETLIKKMQTHTELNKRLFWLNGISDEYLEKMYEASSCLIAASEGEGFGLPLIEAAQKGLPIIARDIPVFKEVAGEHAYYFPNTKDPEVLASSLKEWLQLYEDGMHPTSEHMPWLTWKESTSQLMECIFKKGILDEKNT